ncbi:MAG TPA: 50S ribosomal protein L11 methyltransferase [Betaproteobacteria bacterium]|jgi:ribosomal protein L11 methyltransferase|nr:50S ribosomal protein L11 methyltransferase [Burkholderiales bacterium]HBZ19471.1 50S ribosomal protein L11 methyltransferase [Betaproteobacteria bacterium]
MAWQALEFEVSGADVEALSDALFDAGALSIDVTDADEGSVKERAIYLEPGEEILLSWGYNLVVGLFDKDIEVADIFSFVSDVLQPLQLSPPQTRLVDDQDWVRLTQQQFQPIQITKRLQISPSWSAVKVTSEINIILDPGLAFGTGSHPTTQLCLHWLESNLVSGQAVIDYGCGSGVLGIAAKMFGAGRVVGIDIDEDALAASQYNALRNEVDLEVVPAGDSFNEQVDIVIANILPSPLKVLAPLLSQLVKPGGDIVLSGILVSHEQELLSIYGQWFEMSTFQTMDDWVCLQGTKLSS